MKKILVTGANGYIASNIIRFFRECNYSVIAMSRQQVRDGLDGNYRIVKGYGERELFAVIDEVRPDIIIHTVWINSLLKCETEKDLADFVNIEISKTVISAIKSVDNSIKLVFISSDYVFDGKNGSYKERDECSPSTYYGKNKIFVEDLIRKSCPNHIISRTANVFCNGGRFFNFLYNNLLKDNAVEAFYDAFFSPTYMMYFLDSLEKLIDIDYSGTIHLAGQDRVSRYNFAFHLAAAMGKREDLVVPVKVPSDMLIAHDVSLDSSYLRGLLSNYSPNIDRALQFLLERIEYPYFSFSDARGSIVGITQNDSGWEEINYIEAGKGTTRGGHYHKETREGFFIIEGKIKVTLKKLNSADEIFFTVGKGDIFYIDPMWVHTFYALENAKWINFLSKSMKVGHKDIYNE